VVWPNGNTLVNMVTLHWARLVLGWVTVCNLASPLEPKNTNHSSHMLSPAIRLHNCFFPSVPYLLFYCVCVCLLSTILFSLWQLLSINDIYISMEQASHVNRTRYSADVCLMLVLLCHPLPAPSFINAMHNRAVDLVVRVKTSSLLLPKLHVCCQK